MLKKKEKNSPALQMLWTTDSPPPHTHTPISDQWPSANALSTFCSVHREVGCTDSPLTNCSVSQLYSLWHHGVSMTSWLKGGVSQLSSSLKPLMLTFYFIVYIVLLLKSYLWLLCTRYIFKYSYKGRTALLQLWTKNKNVGIGVLLCFVLVRTFKTNTGSLVI